MAEEKHRVLPARIADLYCNWTLQARLLRLVHLCLVLIATTSSVLAAVGMGKLILPTWLPAIAIGCVLAFELGNKANNVRTAWRDLYAAIMRFEQEPEYTVEQLIQAYERAEKVIGDVNANLKH